MTTQDKASQQGVTLREAQESPFETWWEEHGQYSRSGGGQYEKTFAWNAWCAALSQPPAPEQASGEAVTVPKDLLVKLALFLKQDCSPCMAEPCQIDGENIGVHSLIKELDPFVLSASPAAPVAAKPEQQAQAGEPEVVAHLHPTMPHSVSAVAWPNARPLITLQSHREAMAEVTRRFEELKRHGVSYHVHNDVIAKKDAALQACVGALESLFSGKEDPNRAQRCSDAIQQAKEALK